MAPLRKVGQVGCCGAILGEFAHLGPVPLVRDHVGHLVDGVLGARGRGPANVLSVVSGAARKLRVSLVCTSPVCLFAFQRAAGNCKARE